MNIAVAHAGRVIKYPFNNGPIIRSKWSFGGEFHYTVSATGFNTKRSGLLCQYTASNFKISKASPHGRSYMQNRLITGTVADNTVAVKMPHISLFST